jgi:transcriptional regulator with XRE-family HTH domain
MWTPKSKEERRSAPLAVAVRLIRERRGESIRAFAEGLGCPTNSIVQYEWGRMVPGPGRLIRLLRLAQNQDEAQPIVAALETAGISMVDLDLSPPLSSIQPQTPAATGA